MPRRPLRSLRLRLAVLIAAVVLVAAAAATAVVWTVKVADEHVSALSAAQRRLELLSTISSRVGDYALIALQTTETRELSSDRLSLPRKRVQEAFERLNGEVGREVNAQSDPETGTMIAARSRVFAFMRARFDFLDRQTLQSIKDAREGNPESADGVKVALNAFASGFSPALGQAIEEERSAARDAEAAMGDLRARFAPYAGLAVALALVIAFLLYRVIVGPILSQVSQVAGAAADIARGRTDIRLAVRGHDELSLLMTRFNRMALSLSRRERKLLAAQLQLQAIVDARTAELREANDRLSDIDQARRRFFTDVSHELRTPLTVILGEADVTLRGQAGVDDLRAALSTIRARARGLHRRVEDLLRVARSDNGQLDLNFAAVSVADILSAVRDGAAGAAAARQVAVTVQPPDAGVAVDADADWLRQVVEGLVANALRHSKAGGAIRISAEAGADGLVSITVADDGEGISEADLPRVFERFYRGAANREGGGGFGIGLALARWVIERHGGEITIDSRTAASGRASGTTVIIRLPAVAPRLALGAQR